jgi:hypothetical protein
MISQINIMQSLNQEKKQILKRTFLFRSNSLSLFDSALSKIVNASERKSSSSLIKYQELYELKLSCDSDFILLTIIKKINQVLIKDYFNNESLTMESLTFTCPKPQSFIVSTNNCFTQEACMVSK